MAPPGRMKTAFVLAGGGSLGSVEAGMLRALLAEGEMPDFVVGASAGAINGAYFAAQPDKAGVAKLEAIWRGLTRRDVFPLTLTSLAGLFLRRDYLVDSIGLRRLRVADRARRGKHPPLDWRGRARRGRCSRHAEGAYSLTRPKCALLKEPALMKESALPKETD